jgi:membrane-bound serine protease (ClpP class)
MHERMPVTARAIWPLVGWLALLAAALFQATSVQAADHDYGRVGYASLSGPIDRLRHRYLNRVVEAARDRKLDTLVLHIDTDGGEVSHAREMFKRVIDQREDGPRMVAFIDFRAISAGAMVSYAHEEIYISPGASIGDIGVIFISREGEMKYAPEKVETVVRSLLSQAAELRGWDKALLLKMTARTQKLYRVTLPDDTQRYVIEDDLPELLAQYPQIDPENRSSVYVYRGEDRLLTLTGQEAVKLGMASALVSDKAALFVKLGVEDADVIDLSPRFAEQAAWQLATIAPLLAGLAFLFILFELKTPGVGVWALLATVCGAGFLLAQYYLDMAENIEVVLLLAGLMLIAVDVLLGIGAGLLAATGGTLAFLGLLLSFVPNELEIDPSNDAFVAALQQALVSSFVSMGVVIVGVLLLIGLMPRSSLRRRFAVAAEVGSTSAGVLEQGADALLGQTGITRDALHPGGMVELGGQLLSARAKGGKFIDAGVGVEVVGVEFGEVLVAVHGYQH